MITSSPISELWSCECLIVHFEPTIVSVSVELSTLLPLPSVTFGPMVAFDSVTSSSTNTGSWIVTLASTFFGRRAAPFSSTILFVSSSVSSLPASYHPSTSITFSFAPLSIMYWKASVR